MVTWRPGQLPIGQTAKARSGYRVQSLPSGRDRQYEIYAICIQFSGMVKIEHLEGLIGLGIGIRRSFLKFNPRFPASGMALPSDTIFPNAREFR